MELSYQVRGSNGEDYGSVTIEELNTWVREGRIHAQHEVKRNDMEYWARAGDFSELKPVFASVQSAAPVNIPSLKPASATAEASPATLAQLKSGASWFYWIAGLSLVNSISAFAGSEWRFILGLGITQVFDALGTQIGSAGKVVVLGLDLVVAGLFVLFGVFANKAHSWAFITGMVLFALDGLIFLLGSDWLGVGFHVFALFCFFRGFTACRELKAGQ